MSISSRKESKSDSVTYFQLAAIQRCMLSFGTSIQKIVKDKKIIKSFINQCNESKTYSSYHEAYKNREEGAQNPEYFWFILKFIKDNDTLPISVKDLYSIYPIFDKSYIEAFARRNNDMDTAEAKGILREIVGKEGIITEYQKIKSLKKTFVFGLYDNKPQEKPQDLRISVSSHSLFKDEKPEKEFSLNTVSQNEIYEKNLIKGIFKYLG